MSFGLTNRQAKTLEFIKAEIAARGVAPRLEDIKQHLQLSSRGAVHAIMLALEQRGHIRRLPHQARAIEVVESNPDDVAREALTKIGASLTDANVARIATALNEARSAA